MMSMFTKINLFIQVAKSVTLNYQEMVELKIKFNFNLLSDKIE